MSSEVKGQYAVRAAMREAAVRFAIIVFVVGARKVVWVLYHFVVILGGEAAMEPVI